MIRVVPATQEAVRAIYKGGPVRSMRAVAFERDGEILGCAGLYLEPGHLVMFFDGKREALLSDPRVAFTACRTLQRIASEIGLPIYAKADERIESSDKFLEYMGFKRVNDDRVYTWR